MHIMNEAEYVQRIMRKRVRGLNGVTLFCFGWTFSPDNQALGRNVEGVVYVQLGKETKRQHDA